MKTTLTIKGTHCAACKSLIEDIASEIPGIASATVDYTSGKTIIEHDESVNWSKFKQEVEASGPYTFELPR
jgi:copper chaperone CopZ